MLNNFFFTILGRTVMDFLPLQRKDAPGRGQVAGRSREWTVFRPTKRSYNYQNRGEEIRSRNSRKQDKEGGDFPATEVPDTGHRGQMSAEPMSG